jgi:hypothetical protein
VRGIPQLPCVHIKAQVLKTHKCEKHFKVSHKKLFHKVEVRARIYFRITG